MEYSQDDFNAFGGFGGAMESGPGGPAPQGHNRSGPGEQQYSAVNNVGLWQEQNYMAGNESGFHSNATSQPSSRTGHEDGLEDGFHTGPGSLYDMDSIAPSEVGSTISSSHPGLADPVEHIPQLVTSLSDEDVVVVQESLHLVARSVRKEHFNETFFNALIRSSDLVRSIVNAMSMAFQTMIETTNTINNGSNNNQAMIGEAKEHFEGAEKRARIASDILRAMTNQPDSREELLGRPSTMHNNRPMTENQRIACSNILFSGGVGALTRLVACNVDRIKFNGAITIHNVLLSLKDVEKEKAKNQVREACGANVMAALLEGDTRVKLLTILCDSLNILSTAHPETKRQILKFNGTASVLNILKTAKYHRLIEKAVKLLQVLSVCPDNKKVIIQSGGMEILAKYLNSTDRIPIYCSLTMRNLSDTSAGINNPDKLALALVGALQHQLNQVKICSAAIISNLTVNNDALKLGVCKARGIEGLVNAIDVMGANKDFLDPAMSALRHLTNNHCQAAYAQDLFVSRGVGGFERLQRYLHPETVSPACLKAVLGVLRNLAQRLDYHTELRERGFINEVLKVFVLYFNQMNSNPASAMERVDGVRMIELIDLCMNCLHGFAKSIENRAIVRDPGIVMMLKSRLLLNNPSENVQRLACAVLSELAGDADGCYVIHMSGSCQDIENIITKHEKDSTKQKIVQFACSIMDGVQRIRHDLDYKQYRCPPIRQEYHITIPQQFPQHQHQQPQGPLQIPPNQDAFPNNIRGPPPPNHYQGMPTNPHGPPPPHGGMGEEFDQYPPNGPAEMGPGFEDMMSDMNAVGGPPMAGFDGRMPPMGSQGGHFMPDDMMFGPEDGNFFGNQP